MRASFGAMADAPNPEAIAWYLGRSEDLLDDLRERVRVPAHSGEARSPASRAPSWRLRERTSASVLGTLHGSPGIAPGSRFLIGVLLLVVSLVTALRGHLIPGPRGLGRGGRQLHLRAIHPRARSLARPRPDDPQPPRRDRIDHGPGRQGRSSGKKRRVFISHRPLFGGCRPRYLDRGGDVLNLKLFKKKKKKKFVGPVKANPPPWDVPLDQTKAPAFTARATSPRSEPRYFRSFDRRRSLRTRPPVCSFGQ